MPILQTRRLRIKEVWNVWQGLVNGKAGGRPRSNPTGGTLSNTPLLSVAVRWQPMPQDALTSARAGQQKCVCSDHLLQHNLDLQVAIWTSCPGNIELLVFLWLKAHFQNVITGSTASPGFCHPSWSLQTAPPPNMFPVFVIVVAAASPSNVFGSNFKNPPLPIITNKNSVFPNSLSMNHC